MFLQNEHFSGIGKKVDVPDNFKDDSVTVCVTSFPPRENNLKLCIDSLYKQADLICVYLNDYIKIPDFLKKPNIITYLSSDYINLSANGKIFFLDAITNGYIFTVDDDIIYPSDYVSKCIQCIQKYNREAAVCVHGSIFPETFNWYYERTAIFPYQSSLIRDTFVHLPGSGSFSFHKNTLPCCQEQFLPLTMVDLTFAILCRINQVPLVCIERPQGWLTITEPDGLYQIFTNKITHHTRYAKQYVPWSFEDYSRYTLKLVNKLLDEGIDPEDLDEEFIQDKHNKKLVGGKWDHTSRSNIIGSNVGIDS